MAYNETEWIDNSLPAIDQINLNKIEDGITAVQNATGVHVVDSSNPHGVTQSQVGLGNVNNTSDANKPVSQATQTALDDKSDVGHTHDGSNGSEAISHNDLTEIGVNSHANIDMLLNMSLVDADAVTAVTEINKLITENEQTILDDKIDDLDTDDIVEAGNLYYTNIRADARIQNAIKDDVISMTSMYSSSMIDNLVSGSLIYQGAWDASTNMPTLVDGVGTGGYYYTVNADGTQDLGSGPIDFIVGDKVVYNGTAWEQVEASDTANWGEIYGDMSNQVDLQDELYLKANKVGIDIGTFGGGTLYV